MVALTETGPPGVDLGWVAKQTFGCFSKHWVWLLLIGVPLVFVPAVLSTWLIQLAPVAALIKSAGIASSLVRGSIEVAVEAAPSAVVATLVAYRVSAELGEEPLSGPLDGLRRLPNVFAAKVLADVGITLGRVLLIIPGLLLSLAWAVVTPVAALEGLGAIESLRRSADLTRDRRGAIFLLALVYGLVGAGIGYAALVLARALVAEGGPLPYSMRSNSAFAITTAIHMPVSLVWSVGVVVLYYELLGARRGLGSQKLATIFD